MEDEQQTVGDKIKRALRIAVPVVLVGVLGWFAWGALSERGGVQRRAAEQQVVILTPPPPPPPPPPEPLEEPPPEPVEQEQVTDDPTPAPEPTPEAPAESAALAIDGPPQAGTDSFGVQAGRGGGMTVGGNPNGTGTGPGAVGGGFGDAAYRRYLNGVLQQAINRDRTASRKVFEISLRVWMDGDGRITRSQILDIKNGDVDTSRTVRDIVSRLGRIDEPPPPSMRFPQEITVRGRRI